MKAPRSPIVVFLAATMGLALLVFALLFLPRPTTPFTPDSRHKGELALKAMQGDLPALRELYVLESEENRPELALQGAILGDRAFGRIYFDYYLSIPESERRTMLQAKKLVYDTPKAQCVLEMLKSEAFKQDCFS